MSEKRVQAPWVQPMSESGQGHGLRLLNSLTRQKELFVPIKGHHVDWYICGPTVYDAAHAGHARAYVCFDILRRILRDYFGYQVRYVMNVTDVDDKIIARARRRHLFDKYQQEEKPSPAKVAADVAAALVPYAAKAAAEENAEKAKLFRTQLATLEAALAELNTQLKAGDAGAAAAASTLSSGVDIVSEWLDASRGQGITEHAIFEALARRFEVEFHEDMAALGVEPPDVLTRVSEYVPEIVRFIEGIIEKDFAYEANGSVYFNTAAFNASPDHFYAKLEPGNFGDAAAMREGEGELTAANDDKRSPNDFALWKRSKGGEPRWPSPWGEGRPGWHIECSVMASEVCGPRLDIHSGGSDLKFPHHDNEIAQSEAAFGHDQWANYWLHAGTLRIEGSKMSKSLKNFISIRKALEDYTPRQLRILFLLHGWADALDFSTSTLAIAIAFEKTCNEFFLAVKHFLRQNYDARKASSFAKFQGMELELSGRLAETQTSFHDALCDNMDTKTAMGALKDLISAANLYIAAKEEAKALPNCLLLKTVAVFVTKSLKTFGAISSPDEIGFGAAGGDGEGSVNREELLMPYLDALVDFREQIRTVALANPKEHKEILTACDVIRNKTLPGLGVRLEDKESGTVVKLVSAEELRREADQKREMEARKAAEKAKKDAEKAAKEAKFRVQPQHLFREEKDDAGVTKYSAFDEAGVPTHNAAGEELGKGLRKKLQKISEAHMKKYNDLMAKENSNGVVANGN